MGVYDCLELPDGDIAQVKCLPSRGLRHFRPRDRIPGVIGTVWVALQEGGFALIVAGVYTRYQDAEPFDDLPVIDKWGERWTGKNYGPKWHVTPTREQSIEVR